jgi:intein/homing endonuclease
MLNNKHIPNIYKLNSRENRLRLLAGLLDSDGYYDKEKTSFEFTQKNEKLMDDVIYLSRSLGFACYKSVKNTTWTHKGIKKSGTAFRISITGKGIEEIPTLIPRKKAEPRKQIKDVLVTGITVEYVNEDDYENSHVNINRTNNRQWPLDGNKNNYPMFDSFANDISSITTCVDSPGE